MATQNTKVGFEVFINGQREFFQTLEKMQECWKNIKDEIKQTRESIKSFEATGDLQSITRLNDNLNRLVANEKELGKAVREAKKEMTDVDTILGRMSNSSLKQMKSDLNILKSGFKFIDPSDKDKLDKYSRAMGELSWRIRDAEKATKAVIMPEKELQSVLSNLKTTPINQLKQAQEELTRKINETTRGTKEWIQTSQQLKSVKEQIDDASNSFTKHVGKIEQAISRVKTYLLVYVGFNKLLDIGKDFVSGALQLSDSIANVQKVTKMAYGEVDSLSRAIDSIDSRSSQEQLHNLAYQAGLLGLSAQKDVLGFVKAADQMNWAMKEMGEDGAVQLMKVANLTKEVEKYGVEDALTKIGSAINEITANSAADAKSITEIVSRLAQVGGVAGYTSDQMIALSSTLSALNVRSEMGATAIQRVMTALQTNVSGIAEQLNVSADEIRNQGDSMHQLLFVLDKLKESTATGNNPMETLKPMFKDMSSEGVRLTAVLTTMVDHVDMLKEHLGITTAAFDDGTSMLYEYEIKNETAAALVERMGNALRENFINSDLSRWLQTVLKEVVDIFEHTERHWGVIALIRGSLTALSVFLSRNLIRNVRDLWTLSGKFLSDVSDRISDLRKAELTELDTKKQQTAATELNTIANQAGASSQAEAAAAANAEAAAQRQATLATQTHASAWQYLKALIASNPFASIITVLTTLMTLFGQYLPMLWDVISGNSSLAASIDGAREAIEDMNQEVNDENRRLTELYQRLYRVKTMTGDVNKQDNERKSIINLLNTRYGKYLNNLLSEASSYQQIEEAIKGVNHQIRVQAALKFKETLEEKANSNLAKEQGDVGQSMFQNLEEMFDHIEGVFKKGETEASVSAKIMSLIQDEALNGGKMTAVEMSKSIKDILHNSLVEKNGKPYDTSKIRGTGAKLWLEEQISDLIGDYDDLSKAYAQYEKTQESINKLVEIQARSMGSTADEIARAAEKEESASTAIANATQNTSKILTHALIWDENTDVQALVGWEKKLKDLANMAYTNKERQRLFKEYFGDDQPKTAEEAAKFIQRYADQIHKRLKQDKYQDTGGFRFDDDKKNKDKKNSIEESEAAIAILDAYYQRRNSLIETAMANEELTEEEGARRINVLEQEHLERRAMLRRTFVKDNTETQQKEMKDWWANLEKEGQLASVNWTNILKEWNKADEKQRANNLLALEKDLNKSKKILAKMTDELHKALLEYDPVQKVLEDLRANLDKTTIFGQDSNGKTVIGSLLGIGIDENDKDYVGKIQERFDIIFGYMKDAVRMGTEELRELIQGKDDVWAAMLGDDELKLLLLRMDDFNEKYMQAIKQQSAKLRTRIKQDMKISGEDAQRAEIERMAKEREETAKLVGSVSYFGASEKDLNGMTWVDEAAIETMRMKIQLEKEYLWSLEQRKEAELKAAEKITDAQKKKQEQDAINLKYMELTEEETKKLAELNSEYAKQISEDAMKVADQVTPYADAMVEFADSFGSAVFGSKEDREQAAKDLLKSIIDTTSKILTQYLIMLATKRTFNKIEQIEEDAKNANILRSRQQLASESLGAQAGAAVSGLMIDKAAGTAELISDETQGIGKEVAKHGLIGLAIGSAITIAMTALTSLLKGSIDKSISEVNSIAGVKGKKVAAGMLTYAEGNYPVMGSDGVVYDAKREDRWQTKIYRSPHYGILGERGPELIVDGNTTRLMMTQRPDLYNEIMYLAQGVRVGRAKAYANGNIQEFLPDAKQGGTQDSTNEQMLILQQQLDANNQVMTLLVQQLSNGITIAPFGKNGAVNRLNAAQKWMQKHNL